ncbi:MAG: hypothetical protein OEW31_10460 [Thermoleophilia bacterium]|nr:hypothetical protein [Thermoleophilia bacterium]
MGDWYVIGVTVGVGVAAGILCAGVLVGLSYGWVTSAVGALAIGVVAGLLVHGWTGAGGGIVGAAVGTLSAGVVARGALRSGATIGGTAVILAGAAVFVALLALIPVVGYVLVVALPAVAVRRARSEPERYAGLRTLAK